MKKLPTLVKIIIPIFIMFICTNVNATTITTDTTKPGTTDPDSYLVTNQGTIQVIDVYDNAMIAYKIINIYYNQSTNTFTHEFTTEFQEFLNQTESYKNLTIEDYFQLTSGDITSGSTLTTSTLDKIMSLYSAYVRKNSMEPTVESKEIYPNENITSEAGTYLIIPKSIYELKRYDTYIYAVMVGNIDFVAEGMEWNLKGTEIVAKKTHIDMEKSIGEKGYHIKSFILGRDYTNYVRATIPTYPTNSTNKQYTIIDEFSEGITFSGLTTIKVIIGEDEIYATEEGKIIDNDGNQIATSTFSEQKLTIDFNLDYIYTNTIEIEYKTRLNENAIIGKDDNDGNQSNMTLIYSNDPYGTTTGILYKHHLEAYTFPFGILKYDKDDESKILNGEYDQAKLLNGAVFEIYADEDLTDLVGTITTGTVDEGFGVFIGLAQETYYIKEAKAPTGYKLSKEIIVYELETGLDEGIMEMALHTGGDGYLEIPNEKIQFLPVTGGIGTIIYTATGLLIIAGAFYYIKIYKKKQTNM